jgi:hypothetical protein
MKTFLLVFLSLCFAGGIVAVSQGPPSQTPQKHPAAGVQSTSVMGTVSEQSEKLRFVTDRRAWNVDNPETLRGHEGHYVRVNADVYPDKGSIHIMEVKMPTASESRENDGKRAR